MRSIPFAFAFAFAGCGFLGQEPFGERELPDVAPWQDVGPLTVCDGPRRIGILSEGPLGTCTSQSAAACASDADCGSRETCLCGGCVRAVCETNDQCSADRICTFVEHVCDRACTADADCADGESCVPGQHVCRGTCAQTSDCQAGERCDLTSGLCKPQTCADSSVCGGKACTIQRTPASLTRPFARVDGDRVVLWVDRDGLPARASSGDGRVFTFEPGDPRPDQTLSPALLSPSDVSSSLWQEVDGVDALFLDDQGRLWFTAHGTETGPSSQFGNSIPTPPNWSIGVALSNDGVSFVPYPFNPVFDRTLDFTKHPSELDPVVVTFGGEHLLYYRRAAADGTRSENLAVARNPPR